MKITELIQQIRQPGTRMGIGVWLLPQNYIGQEENLASRLNLESIDARNVYLQNLPQGARFSGLTRPNGYQKLVEMVRELANGVHHRDCLLVHTLDLLLLGLEVNERERFWQAVLEGLPYPRTKLVLTIMENAHSLFPPAFIQRYAALIAQGSL